MTAPTPLHLRPAVWVRAYLERTGMSDAELGTKVWPTASPTAAKERIRAMRAGRLSVGFQADVARALGIDGEQFYMTEETRDGLRFIAGEAE